MKLCQLDQGAMIPTQQKVTSSLNSAFTTTDIASQTELQQEHAATQVSECRTCPDVVPVQDSSSEHTCGRCTQVKELHNLILVLSWNYSLQLLEKYRTPTLACLGDRFRSLGDWSTESMEWQSWKAEPRKAEHSSKRSARVGHLHVLNEEPAKKKTCLAEQGALTGSQEKQRSFMSFRKWGRQLRKTTRML